MTPNPKNIGAAPEEPKTARVWRVLNHFAEGPCVFGPTLARDEEVFVQEILPSPDAVGVPEPQPKGPSLPEVTQPGEGVEVAVMFRDNGDCAWWKIIDVPAVGQFNDGEMFRATLRRESK